MFAYLDKLVELAVMAHHFVVLTSQLSQLLQKCFCLVQQQSCSGWPASCPLRYSSHQPGLAIG